MERSWDPTVLASSISGFSDQVGSPEQLILLEARTIRLGEQASIEFGGTSGNPNPIRIAASKRVLLEGASSITTSGSDSPPAPILIEDLEEQEGRLRVELRERSEILTLTGNLASPIPRVGISVRARKLRLDDSILATSRSLGGPAPLEIEIDVKRLALSHGAEISASGFGGGGTIGITARDRVRITDSTLASAGDSRGRGGRISMSGSPAVLLERSQIDVSGSAGGGEVALGVPEARLGSVVLRSSAVDASSDQADGGSIAIYTNAFVASSDSSLNVTGATGDGTVSIDTRPASPLGERERRYRSPPAGAGRARWL